MGAAAGVEWLRLQRYREGRLLGSSSNATYEIVDISVFWQTPQYLLVGLSEVQCITVEVARTCANVLQTLPSSSWPALLFC